MTRNIDWDQEERNALDAMAGEVADLSARHRGDPAFDLLRAARAEALPDPLHEHADAYLSASLWSRALVDGADAGDVSLDPASTDRLLARIIRDGKREADGRHVRRRWLWAPAFALASIAAVLTTVLLVRDRPRSGSPAADRQVSAPAAPLDSRPSFRLPLDAAAVKLTPMALVVRGEGTSGRFMDEAAPALNAYRSGDYETAARDFEALQLRYPRSVEVVFYLGVARLFIGDSARAVQALEAARALNEPSFKDDIEWYLAVAYERAGGLEKTRALVDTLCGGGGAYSARACAAAPTFP